MSVVDEMGTIFGVWAHPDDEAYLAGGIMAMAVVAGRRVACMTATRGEAGESADPRRWPPEQLGTIREAELASTLALLGVTEHEWLDLPDGGLAEVEAHGAVERVVAALERVRPDTVLTFGPDGMTGHPDHRTVSAWTAEAFDAAAPAGARLLVATKTPEWIEAFADLHDGIFPPGTPPCTPRSEALVVTLDDAVLERKVAALEAQASQISGAVEAFGRDRFAEWVREEAFERVR